LAVKPATNPGNLKLKKTAVKIVTPAGPAPGSPAALHKKGGAVISTPLENLRTEVKMYVKISLKRPTNSRTSN
jgi:hypothetical protein